MPQWQQVDLLQRHLDRLKIFAAQSTEPAQMRHPPLGHDLLNPKGEGHFELLRNQSDRAGKLPPGPLLHRAALHQHLARGRTQQSSSQLEQRRLAHSVRPHQRNHFARAHRE